jgi:RimJ/RimL family protein N-acetyltransferase
LTSEPIEFPVEGLVGDGIRLRLRCDADIPALVKACQDPAIQRYTTVPADYGEANARDYAQMAANGLAEGREVALVIADSESDELLGTIALRRAQNGADAWDVGYFVAPWARGRGIATAAVRLLTRFGFDELGAARIELVAEPENTASTGVAERAGFRRERLIADHIEIKGSRRDVVMYSLLPNARQ